MQAPDPRILTEAAKAVAETTGLTLEARSKPSAHPADPLVDGELRVRWDDQERAYPVQLRGTITNATLPAVAEQLQRLGAILVTSAIP